MRLAILACLLLCACKTTVDVQTTCLPVKPYTAAQQQQMAAELAALPLGSVLAQAMVDYGQMRAGARACAATKP